MTIKQAWKKIGVAYYKETWERDYFEYKLVAVLGLCYAIKQLWFSNKITLDQRNEMLDSLEGIPRGMNLSLTGLGECYFWSGYFDDPTIRANQIARADFCFLMYYEAGGK